MKSRATWGFVCLFLIVLTESVANSDQIAPTSSQTISQVWNKRRSYLAQIPSELSNNQCSQRWQPLVNDGSLDIVVAMGYYEAAVGRDLHSVDQSFAKTFIRHLTSPCTNEGYNACGFHIVGTDPDYGFTNMTKLISDRSGRPIHANVTVIHSSVSWLDSDNRGYLRVSQQDKSEAAQVAFNLGLRYADVVFYNGHARDGGGPDFFYPRLTHPGSTHVDYNWYQASRPGIRSLLSEIQRRDRQVQLLGLFACATNRHFAGQIKRAAPGLGYIGTNVVSGKHLIEVSLMGAMDATLGQKCQAGFNTSLHVNDRYPVTLSNFF